MFWSEEDNVEKEIISTQLTDVSIHLQCTQLPADHIYLLASEIIKILPWLAEEPRIAIQQIYIPVSGNGWQRNELGDNDELIYLSKRTRLKIRLPNEYLDSIQQLSGKEVMVAGNRVKFGNIKTAKISANEILVSRFVYFPGTEDDEDKLLTLAYQQFKQNNISIKKMLCGKPVKLNINNRTVLTRSLMLADLTTEDSIKIQETGIGDYYLYGCGVFIPQKGIKSVNKED